MVTDRSCDVLVVGGGPAGIAAAVAAARSGASVVLLEKYGFLGGQATAGMVGTICGLYHRGGRAGAKYVCGGFAREWAERLAQASSSKCVELSGGLRVLPFHSWAFKRLADEVVGDSPNLTPVLHGVLTSLDARDGRVREARALVWNRPVAFRPDCIVDCTGEATAVGLAGGRTEDGAGRRTASIMFSMDALRTPLDNPAGRLAALRDVVEAVQNGSLPPACINASFMPPVIGDSSVCLKVAIPGDGIGDWNEMAELEIRARKIVDELSRYLAKSIDAFRGARLGQVAVQVGVRAGRRLAGRYVLTERDVLECRKFRDGVARGAWPIEEWGPDLRPRLTHLPEGGYYEIPADCLIADGLENFFAAGCGISASPRGIASARVIATSFSTGWAAGKLAACRVAGKPLSLAVEQIREEQVPGDVEPERASGDRKKNVSR